MTDRRQVLKGGLAATALPLAASAAAAVFGAEVRTDSIRLYTVLYDTRFEASVAFARRVAANGDTVHAINGDVTRFWYEDLYHRWRNSPVAIAGLTARGALFCLEQLAWDQRMRVVLRAEHAQAGSCVVHAFEGSATVLAAATKAAAEPDWPVAMADVVTQCSAQLPRSAVKLATVAPTATVPASEPLFSWVIAPVARSV